MELLARTPVALEHLLTGLSPEWTDRNEGPGTWSVFEVISHLLKAERTNWMVRTELILSEQDDKRFLPFDRQPDASATLETLLAEFRLCRTENLQRLNNLALRDEDFAKTALHPDFGAVTLSQLLSTWTVHDLNHIAQITRIMAYQYAEAVGPWKAFLPIIRSR